MRASVPLGHRVYAIGDIHGRYDLLDELLRAIEVDDASRGGAHTVLVFLGDYVDRGPRSKQVIDRLIDGPLPGSEAHFLKGNHEVMLQNFLRDPLEREIWVRNGGSEALLSYGVEPSLVRLAAKGNAHALLACAVELAEGMGDKHLSFLAHLEYWIRIGGYIFVHAGIRPGLPMEKQSPDDLLWIRSEFLTWRGDHEAVIVHGHTPVKSIENLENRIDIDTMAWKSGRLTAVGLEGEDRWFLSTGVNGFSG